jgi:hypothetical protein
MDNDDMQLWTVRAFDDASARVPLPPRDRWVPTEVQRDHAGPVLAVAALAILLALSIALWLGFGDRLVPSSSAKPIPPGGMVLIPGSSESSTWGGVYEHSLGATVLRPTWLPFAVEKTNSSVVTGGRFIEYAVGYVTNDYRDPQLFFLAEAPDATAPPRLGPGEHSTDVTVRGGRDAQLITASDGRPRVIWTENELRYTVQAVAATISSNDLLRVVEGLAAVVSPSGATR